MRAHFYLLTVKYQHKLFVLIFSRSLFRTLKIGCEQRKAENNLKSFSIFIFFHILASMQTRSKGINFCITFKIRAQCEINRTNKIWYEYRILVCQHISFSLSTLTLSQEYVYIFYWIYIICIQIASVILYYKVMNLFNKVFKIFSWCFSGTKRYWTIFVWYCCIHYIWHCFVQKQSNLSYVAGSSFRCFKNWISEEKRTKPEVSRGEQKQKIKLKKAEISVFT